MNSRHALQTMMAAVVALAALDAAHAQSSLDPPFGSETSGDHGPSIHRTSAGAGYSFIPPTYQIGWTPAYFFGGYGTLLGSPAYLSTTRAPQLNFIQPQYQSAYQFDRGGPAFGFSPLPLNYLLPTTSHPLSSRSAAYHSTRFTGAVFRPYVTVSQYVYTPTYVSTTSPPATMPYGAVYGAYGYSAFSRD